MRTPSLILAALSLIFTAHVHAQAPAGITVNVLDGDQPVLNAKVALILKSGAYQMAKLAGDAYTCQPPAPCIKVFAAAPGYEAGVMKVPAGATGAITVSLKPSPTKNSAIIESAGPLPGIQGRVNPILDKTQRLFFYAKEIGLLEANRPAMQPIKFTLKHEINAETATGQRFKIWVIDITQQVSVLEYTMPS